MTTIVTKVLKTIQRAELFTCRLIEIIQCATCMCVFVGLSIVHKIKKKR